jgi:hypothetical protein
MKRIIVFVVLFFVFGCNNPIAIYKKIETLYPNSQIVPLQGDGDQYIIYTENKEIRFINVGRVNTTIEIDQKIDLIVKE